MLASSWNTSPTCSFLSWGKKGEEKSVNIELVSVRSCKMCNWIHNSVRVPLNSLAAAVFVAINLSHFRFGRRLSSGSASSESFDLKLSDSHRPWTERADLISSRILEHSRESKLIGANCVGRRAPLSVRVADGGTNDAKDARRYTEFASAT